MADTQIIRNITQPWESQQGYLQQGFGQAQNLYNQFGNSAVGFSPQTSQGFTGLEGQVGNNLALAGQAQGLVGDMLGGQTVPMQQMAATASGDYLNSNPYLDQMFGTMAGRMGEQFNRAVMPGLEARYSAAGRMGSGLEQRAFADANQNFADSLAQLGAQIYGQNYQQERGRQMDASNALYGMQQGALGAVPQSFATLASPYGQLIEIGRARENQARYEADEPARRLAQYMAMVSGNYGQASTQTQPLYSNPAAGALGGALSGFSLGNSLAPDSRWGGLLGAGLGGLAGFLGS